VDIRDPVGCPWRVTVDILGGAPENGGDGGDEGAGARVDLGTGSGGLLPGAHAGGGPRFGVDGLRAQPPRRPRGGRLRGRGGGRQTSDRVVPQGAAPRPGGTRRGALGGAPRRVPRLRDSQGAPGGRGVLVPSVCPAAFLHRGQRPAHSAVGAPAGDAGGRPGLRDGGRDQAHLEPAGGGQAKRGVGRGRLGGGARDRQARAGRGGLGARAVRPGPGRNPLAGGPADGRGRSSRRRTPRRRSAST